MASRNELTPQQIVFGGAVIFTLVILGYLVSSGFFTVREFENAVVLRFGEHVRTVGPGLHFKLPWVEQRVLVDTSEKSLRMPWGVSELQSNDQPLYVERESEDEALVLTGDLFAAVVEWNVVWRVVEPADFLFSINEEHLEPTIIAIARSAMERIVGDYSADEILTGKREEITRRALDQMRKTLTELDCGVAIVDLQLQRITPPSRVKPSFDDVNASIQERDRLVNDARKERNKLIPAANAQADKTIREAEGYASRRRAESEGEIAALLAKYESYSLAPEITRRRMYLESMERVLGQSGPKLILDEKLQNLMPLLPLNEPSAAQPTNPPR